MWRLSGLKSKKGLNYIDVMRAIDAVIEKERSKK